jgi:uncharacterized protein (DUF2252 family)
MDDPPDAVRRRASNRVTARAEAGRAARKRAPRRAASWHPRMRETTALERLRAQEGVRDPALLPLRYDRMAASPWTYLRGAAAVMAADLAAVAHSGLTVQMCGDAHILNFGLWASPERRLLFDVRDFDETLPGPFEWDVTRLATSILVLAETERLARSRAEEAVVAAVEEYRRAMRRYARMGELDVWYDAIAADAPLRGLRSQFTELDDRDLHERARSRSHHGTARRLVYERDGRRRIGLDPAKRLEDGLSDDERARASEELYDSYLASIPPHLRRLVERFTLVDSVRQIVGVGSVGMRVWLNLLEGDSGRQPLFAQVKQATTSVYEEFLGPSGFAHHGERVVAGQRLMQSASDIFLGHMRVGGFDYYNRQFRDMKIIPEGPRVARSLASFAAVCGRALAKAHARSGDPAAIAGYIGKGAAFTDGILALARAHAAQTVVDHADLRATLARGELTLR